MANTVPEDFVAGLEGVVAFTTDIAEPDKNGGNLRYRGVDIEDLVAHGITFGDVWSLLVDGRFGRGLPPAEPFPLPIHSGDVRVDVQAGLAIPVGGRLVSVERVGEPSPVLLARSRRRATALVDEFLDLADDGVVRDQQGDQGQQEDREAGQAHDHHVEGAHPDGARWSAAEEGERKR